MFGAQGKIPRIKDKMRGRLVGRDSNQNVVNNSVEYRGRPYSIENAIDMERLDYQREVWKLSVQKGLKTLALYLQTSKINPNHP
jgi:hypothetical protein